jgi:hypothetical protein
MLCIYSYIINIRSPRESNLSGHRSPAQPPQTVRGFVLSKICTRLKHVNLNVLNCFRYKTHELNKLRRTFLYGEDYLAKCNAVDEVILDV